MWNKLISTTLLSWMIKKKNNNKQSSVPGFALFFLCAVADVILQISVLIDKNTEFPVSPSQ